jgi:stage III sporulation protein SpoIIIAA
VKQEHTHCTDNIELLLAVLPPAVRTALERHPDLETLVEVVLDLGRLPEARFPDNTVWLGDVAVTREDVAHATACLGAFTTDNRAGIERTLHRISALRNRAGDVVGLTCRVGRTRSRRGRSRRSRTQPGRGRQDDAPA